MKAYNMVREFAMKSVDITRVHDAIFWQEGEREFVAVAEKMRRD